MEHSRLQRIAITSRADRGKYEANHSERHLQAVIATATRQAILRRHSTPG
jgi:hypothetical protein